MIKSGPCYEEAMQYPCTRVSLKACNHDRKRENTGHAQGHNRKKKKKKSVVRSGFQPKFYAFSLLLWQRRQSQTLRHPSSVREGNGQRKHAYSCELWTYEDIPLPGALTWLCLLTRGHNLLPLLLLPSLETLPAHSCLNCPKDKFITTDHLAESKQKSSSTCLPDTSSA